MSVRFFISLVSHFTHENYNRHLLALVASCSKSYVRLLSSVTEKLLFLFFLFSSSLLLFKVIKVVLFKKKRKRNYSVWFVVLLLWKCHQQFPSQSKTEKKKKIQLNLNSINCAMIIAAIITAPPSLPYHNIPYHTITTRNMPHHVIFIISYFYFTIFREREKKYILLVFVQIK